MKKFFAYIRDLSGKRFPRNFVMKNPFAGAFVLVAFCFIFLLIYKPLSVRESKFFSFGTTLAIYSLMMYLPAALTGKALNNTRYFSEKSDWTFLKDLLSYVIIILVLGIIVYLLGFIMEDYHKRLNLSTFLNSIIRIILICIVPFLIPLLFNYRYLLISDTVVDFLPDVSDTKNETLKPIKIASRLKKEQLSFPADQLIYAESDGNYVNFYLSIDNKTVTKTIRNSIIDIEEQLSSLEFIFRTHRAFLVNIKMIKTARGNSLGYRLKLNGSESEIPVARNRVPEFNMLVKRLH